MTPTDPTTTVTPPAEAEGDAALNAGIAKALGWKTVSRGNGRLLIEPDGKERWDGASHIEAECWRAVPRYVTDPAAALGLLAYVLTMTRHDEAIFYVGGMGRSISGKWHIILQSHMMLDEWRVEASTLERAIARSCLAALTAIGEVGDWGGESIT